MRILATALALIACNTYATTCFRIIPSEFAGASQNRLAQHYVESDFASSTLVFEGTVVSDRTTPGYTLAKVQVDRYWKSDGKPVQVIYLPMQPCDPSAEVGKSYLFFARRAQGLLPHVSQGKALLALISSLPAAEVSSETRAILSGLGVVPVHIVE